MEIHLAKPLADNPKAKAASEWVRKCVHCGFCNATCPTYQLLGDEADGPRGRIYLMKQMLESGQADSRSRVHLDRCLLCRNCETTCPSGVQYSSLLELGRELQQDIAPRSMKQTIHRKALTALLLKPQPLKGAIKIGQLLRPILPKAIKQKLPDKIPKANNPQTLHSRKMLMLKGCVQSSLAPNTNTAAARVLDKFGISLLEPNAGCCGAMRLHTNSHDDGLSDIKQLIDQWWPVIESGVEAIIVTASGCGVTVKDYGQLLKGDSLYAGKAKKISGLAKDVSEVISQEIMRTPNFIKASKNLRIAFQSPCTLQHGLKLNGVVENILRSVGFTVLDINDGHLCCGSAGTYSFFQREISERLKENKIKNLMAGTPDLIATANVGCQLQLKSDSSVKVVHWIEILDEQTINEKD